MKRFFNSTFTLMISLVPLFMLQTGIAHSRSGEDPRGYVICDRIKRQGICEEYRINTLSPADRQLITKHCTVGAFATRTLMILFLTSIIIPAQKNSTTGMQPL